MRCALFAAALVLGVACAGEGDDKDTEPSSSETTDSEGSDTELEGLPEQCNGVDDDLDGRIDEEPMEADGLFADLDGDGYGGAAADCDTLADAVEQDGDCDDNDADIHPGALETCDTADLDCDGLNGLEDGDGDGYASCEDCDDDDDSVHPDATETCDAADQDCDDTIDEHPSDGWRPDNDGDGFGPDTGDYDCVEFSGGVQVAGDCDDGDSAVNPDAEEVCDTGDHDENCDGLHPVCKLEGTLDPYDADLMIYLADARGDESMLPERWAGTLDHDGDGVVDLVLGGQGEVGDEARVYIVSGPLTSAFSLDERVHWSERVSAGLHGIQEELGMAILVDHDLDGEEELFYGGRVTELPEDTGEEEDPTLVLYWKGGTTVRCGDVSGDGLSEVLALRNHDTGDTDIGERGHAVLVEYGASGDLRSDWGSAGAHIIGPQTTPHSNSRLLRLGTCGGDVTGDGYADLFLTGTDGLDVSANWDAGHGIWRVDGPVTAGGVLNEVGTARYGIANDVPADQGDVLGDGTWDVCLNNRLYTQPLEGSVEQADLESYSVRECLKYSVGDVNGDGFDELVNYDFTSMDIVQGSSDTGDISRMVKVQFATAYSMPPARIGDINGDGIDDLATGADLNLDGTLYLWVYWGETRGR